MEDLLAGLALVLAPAAMFYLVFGVTAGFIVGVLPGFSSANAAAILLPFTLILDVEVGLIFLVGIYAGASFSGGVPAILLNVPGTGSAAATALDGYPMAVQGKAERAIGIARAASAIGGALAALITLALLPPLARVAIQFGSLEMFLLAAFGLTVIATIVGSNTAKGLTSALLGVLISAMSASPMTGRARFDLGFLELYDQVPFVPALIGLFAVAQMVELVRRKALVEGADMASMGIGDGSIRGRLRNSLVEFKAGVMTTLSYPKELIRATLIGTGIGAIPGAGTSVATFVAYGEAKRASKTPERFGHGAPEGVLAAEASENATAAGTLVPTLALGIPGGASAAVMLAALYLQGIRPGPQLFQENGPEAYAVLLGMFFASILILPLGAILATPMTYITRVRPALLVPSVTAFALIGSYSVRYLTFDVGLAVVFGLLATVMKLRGYPVVPMVLGLILGPLAEDNFLRALRLGNSEAAYFFQTTRPIALVLWALLILSVAYNLVAARKKAVKHREAEAQVPGNAVQ